MLLKSEVIILQISRLFFYETLFFPVNLQLNRKTEICSFGANKSLCNILMQIKWGTRLKYPSKIFECITHGWGKRTNSVITTLSEKLFSNISSRFSELGLPAFPGQKVLVLNWLLCLVPWCRSGGAIPDPPTPNFQGHGSISLLFGVQGNS